MALDDEEREHSEATNSSSLSRNRSFAHEHPWLLAVITSVLVAIATSVFVRIIRHDDPRPVGVAGTIGAFRYQLKKTTCLPSKENRTIQVCTAFIELRNDGNRLDYPAVSVAMLVGDEVYEDTTAFYKQVLPHRSVEERVSFDIPLGVNPTQLRVTSNFEGFWDLIVPFYNEWIVYDLG